MRKCAVTVIGLGVVGMCTSDATAQPSEMATLLDKIQALEQLVVTQHAAMQTQIATLQRSQQALEVHAFDSPTSATGAAGPVLDGHCGVYEGTINTAVGDGALSNKRTRAGSGFDTGTRNTAMGRQTLWSDSMGSSNTASRYQALFSNTTGS